MKKQLFFLLLCLLASSRGDLHGQAPGYLGKRFFMHVGAAVAPIYTGPTASNHGRSFYGDKSAGTLGFNFTPKIELGYALTRQHALNLSVGYFKTGMIPTRPIATAALPDGASGGGGADYHYLFYHLSGPVAAVAWQTFNPLKGSIAPMGFFTKYGLEAAFVSGKVVDKRTEFYDSGQTRHEILGIETSTVHLSFGMGFGQQIIFKDKFLVKLATNFRMPLQLTRMEFLLEDSFTDDSLGNQDIYISSVFSRLSRYFLFDFQIGTGLLF